MESRKIFGNIKDIKISDSDEEDIKVYDDFFDDLPEDILDSKQKKSIIPKSNSEKKKDKIETAIKIRSKFR